MKKIDLHIHTFATPSDAHFEFSLDTLIDYVRVAKLDAIAVTNHNAFDGVQFNTIKSSLDIPVFPGIEIDLEGCHLLLISDGVRLDDFNQKCASVTKEIPTANDDITVAQLKEIFGRLDEYLLIPHTAKSPSIRPSTLQQLAPHVTAGEVPSAKHFIRALKNEADLTPVLFSDSRITDELQNTPTRQTYIDCGEISLTAVKMCLTDKSKVALSEKDGNDLFQVFDNGQMLSTGLNILLGERSSGKSYTLDRLDTAHQNVKYIRQFELVQQQDEREFRTDIERRRSAFTDDFLRGFKSVVEDVLEVDLHANDRIAGEFVETLLQSADETDKHDAFSNTALFDETAFSLSTHRVHPLVGRIGCMQEKEGYPFG